MRHLRTLALILVLVATACGGDDDASNTTQSPGSDSAATSGSDPNDLTAGFDLADLPDDFPAELVPPSWTAGQATDILGPFAVNFESDMGFADAVAYYDGIFGPSNLIVGDPGEQLAQWTNDAVWIASVLDGDPVLISFVNLTE